MMYWIQEYISLNRQLWDIRSRWISQEICNCETSCEKSVKISHTQVHCYTFQVFIKKGDQLVGWFLYSCPDGPSHSQHEKFYTWVWPLPPSPQPLQQLWENYHFSLGWLPLLTQWPNISDFHSALFHSFVSFGLTQPDLTSARGTWRRMTVEWGRNDAFRRMIVEWGRNDVFCRVTVEWGRNDAFR